MISRRPMRTVVRKKMLAERRSYWSLSSLGTGNDNLFHRGFANFDYRYSNVAVIIV